MDYYHIWFNLKDTSRAAEFCGHVDRYLGRLKEQRLIASYRLTRRKLGFGPPSLGEFHVQIECNDLTQLDQAFRVVAGGDEEVEALHKPVYTAVKDFCSALYRDFPDAHLYKKHKI